MSSSDINDQVLNTPIPQIRLIQNFVTPQEEAYLLTKIEELAGVEVSDENAANRSYKGKATPAGWKEVKGRRLMYWGGQLLPNSKSLVPRPLPPFMDKDYPRIVHRVMETGAFDKFAKDSSSKPITPNHVLVNEYLPGQGIFPHEDGPAYLPTVATLSLGSHTILDIYQYKQEENQSQQETETNGQGRSINTNPLFSVYLPRGSLVILSDQVYESSLHGIAERSIDSLDEIKNCVNPPQNIHTALDRTRRVSLTMRVVEKIKRLI